MQTKEVIARVVEYASRHFPGRELKWDKEQFFKIAVLYKTNLSMETLRRTLDILTAEGRMFTVGKVGGISRNVDGGYTVYTASDAPEKLKAAEELVEKSKETGIRTIVIMNSDETMKFRWTMTLNNLENLARSLLDARNHPEKKVLFIQQSA